MKTKVSEIAQSDKNGTSKVIVIIIRNAPKVDLIIDGKVKTVYAF